MAEENEDAPSQGHDADGTEEAEETAAPDAGPAAEPTKDEPRETAGQEPSRYRRLHRLAGAVALASFLVLHLLTHASALGGAASYEAVAGAIARSSLLPLVEVLFVLVPLGFHAGYGVHLLLRRSEALREAERFGGRRPWTVQRISAVVLLLFVLVHVWQLRLQRLFFGMAADGLYTALTARLSWTWAGVPWMALFYLLGILAAAAHLSNGLFAATAPWKVAAGEIGRKRLRMATTGLGLILFLVGGATVIGLATGTRLLPGADDDSAAPSAPCGSAVPAPTPPFVLPAPSR